MTGGRSFSEQVRPTQNPAEEVKSEIIKAGLQSLSDEIGDVSKVNHRGVMDVVAQNILFNRSQEFSPVSDDKLIARLAKAVEAGLNSGIYGSANEVMANYTAKKSGGEIPHSEVDVKMKKISELQSADNVQKIAKNVLEVMKAKANEILGTKSRQV